MHPVTHKVRDEIMEKRELYPTVSQIYNPWTMLTLGKIDPMVLENACERGVRAHSYCVGYVMGLLIPYVDADCMGYLDSFIEWYDKHVESAILVETRLYDDTLCFSGQPDLIVTLKGDSRPMLVDIKTPVNLSRSWPIQLAAYAHLATVNGIPIDRTQIVRVRKDSSKKALVTDYFDLKPYWNLFEGCLNNYKYFVEKTL